MHINAISDLWKTSQKIYILVISVLSICILGIFYISTSIVHICYTTSARGGVGAGDWCVTIAATTVSVVGITTLQNGGLLAGALDVIYRYLVVWHIAKHRTTDTDTVPVAKGVTDNLSVGVVKSVSTDQRVLGFLPQLHGAKSDVRLKSHWNREFKCIFQSSSNGEKRMLRVINVKKKYLVRCSRRLRHIRVFYRKYASRSSRCCCTPRLISRYRHTSHNTTKRDPLQRRTFHGAGQLRPRSRAGGRQRVRHCCSSTSHRLFPRRHCRRSPHDHCSCCLFPPTGCWNLTIKE